MRVVGGIGVQGLHGGQWGVRLPRRWAGRGRAWHGVLAAQARRRAAADGAAGDPSCPFLLQQSTPEFCRTLRIAWQNHPSLGLLAAKCSYCPTFFPIWGNGRTFSWEPYLVSFFCASFFCARSGSSDVHAQRKERSHMCGCAGQERSVGGGMSEEWTIDYEFGMPASSASRAKL